MSLLGKYALWVTFSNGTYSKKMWKTIQLSVFTCVSKMPMVRLLFLIYSYVSDLHYLRLCGFREKLLFFLGILAHKVPGVRRVVSKYASSCNEELLLRHSLSLVDAFYLSFFTLACLLPMFFGFKMKQTKLVIRVRICRLKCFIRHIST